MRVMNRYGTVPAGEYLHVEAPEGKTFRKFAIAASALAVRFSFDDTPGGENPGDIRYMYNSFGSQLVVEIPVGVRYVHFYNTGTSNAQAAVCVMEYGVISEDNV